MIGATASTGVYGCYLINVVPSASDERGQFLRPYEAVRMAEWCPEPGDVDDLVVRSYPGVFRGMHIQHKDAPQWKYVRATRGIVHGAVLDTSKTRHGNLWAEVVLSADAPRTGLRRDVGLLIPPWCAWGYWAGLETCEVTYRIWGKRVVSAERAILFTSVGGFSGMPKSLMSDRDRLAKPLSEVDTGW